MRGAIQLVHNDFMGNYKETFLRTFEKLKERKLRTTDRSQVRSSIAQMREAGVTKEMLEEYRMVVISTWRVTNQEPLRRSPLAVTDMRTIKEKCLRPTLMGSVKAETMLAEFDPSHEWYYFPNMTQDELILQKQYDSAEGVMKSPTLHTSFHDATTPEDAPERNSIDARVLCLIPPAKPSSKLCLIP